MILTNDTGAPSGSFKSLQGKADHNHLLQLSKTFSRSTFILHPLTSHLHLCTPKTSCIKGPPSTYYPCKNRRSSKRNCCIHHILFHPCTARTLLYKLQALSLQQCSRPPPHQICNFAIIQPPPSPPLPLSTPPSRRLLTTKLGPPCQTLPSYYSHSHQ